MNIRSIKLGAGLSACLLAVVLAGCGDSSEDKKSADTGPKPTFKGEPITLATASAVDSPGGDFPFVFAGAEAAVRAINADGGIKGHEVKLNTCNTKADPNIEVACARQAVDSKAVATVGNLYFRNNTGVLDALNKAQIPAIGATSPTPVDFQNPMVFPVDFVTGSQTPCASDKMSKVTGEDKLTVVNVDNAPGNNNAILAISAAKHYKTGPNGQVVMPESATDFAPYLPQIESKGTTRLLTTLSPPQTPGFIVAQNAAGKKWSMCIPDFLKGDTLTKAGSAANNIYVPWTVPPLSAEKEYPEIKRFKAEMKAQEDSGDEDASVAPENYSSMAMRSWLAVQTVKQVAEKMDGEINNKTFLAALKKAKVDLGLVPPIDFSKPQSANLYTRVFNPTIGMMKWDPGKKEFVLVEGFGTINGLDGVTGE